MSSPVVPFSLPEAPPFRSCRHDEVSYVGSCLTAAVRTPGSHRLGCSFPSTVIASLSPQPTSVAVNASTAAHVPRVIHSPPRLCPPRTLDRSRRLLLFKKYRNKTPTWVGKTVSHLSTIVILTLHGEHFPARPKFARVNLPLTRLTAALDMFEPCYEYRPEGAFRGATPWIGG
jgi:hypothetical protein